MATAAMATLASLGKTILGAGTAVAGAVKGAGAAAAAGGAAGTAGSAGIGSTLATILSGTATALSIMGTMQAGEAEAATLESSALDSQFEAQQEEVLGMERRRAIRQELSDVVADQGNAYAASGIDFTFGTPADARQRAYREADRALNTDGATQQQRSSRLLQRRDLYRKQAEKRRSASFMSAFGQAARFGLNTLQRG